MQKIIIVLCLALTASLCYSQQKEEMTEEQIQKYENLILSGLRTELTIQQFQKTFIDPLEKRKNETNFDKIYTSLNEFIDHYETGSKIWNYYFRTSGAGSGREGYAIIVDHKVVTWIEIAIE